MKKLVINNKVRKHRFLKEEMTQLELAFKLSRVFNMRIDDLFYIGELNESI